MKPKCELYGILCDDYFSRMQDISRRVYSPEGIAPTIHTSGGGATRTKGGCMVIKIKEDGVLVSQATKGGFIFCEWGGYSTWLIPIVSSAEEGLKGMVKSPQHLLAQATS